MRVHTESGSCHEVDTDAMTYRRLQLPLDPLPGSARADLRRDGEQIGLLGFPQLPVIGEPWALVLAPLADGVVFSLRSTTCVVAVEVLD